MSKTLKCVLAGIGLIIAGGLIFVITMTALNWDFYKLDSTKYEAQTFNAIPDSVTQVEIDLDSFPLKITGGDELILNYFEASNATVTVKQEGSVLVVKEDTDFNIMTNGMFNFGRGRYAYSLTVPEGIRIRYTGTNGDITLSGVTTDSLYVKSTNGDVDIRGCNIDSAELHVTNGDISIINGTMGSVVVNSTNMDLDVNGVTADSLKAAGTNADISIENSVIYEISLDSVNADYEVERVQVNELTVKGTNLDAKLIIRGIKSEYTITTRGRGLPAAQTGTTDKFVKITGTNSDVKLQFVAGV